MADADWRDALHTCIALHPRDWSRHHRDAWIYGIVVGWGAESLDALKVLHGWTDETVERLRRLRQAYVLAARAEAREVGE